MSVVISQAILNFIICNLIATWYEKILSDNDIYWRFMFTDFVVVSIASLMYIVLQYSVRYKKERELRILTEINEEKVNNALLREKLEKLSNQADTHFIFNCLGTLQELVREKSDQTEQFITSFTNMYRYMLDAGRQRQTTLEDELIFLEHYSYLVHVRYPEVEISVDYEKGMLKEGYTLGHRYVEASLGCRRDARRIVPRAGKEGNPAQCRCRHFGVPNDCDCD